MSDSFQAEQPHQPIYGQQFEKASKITELQDHPLPGIEKNWTRKRVGLFIFG